MKMPKSPKHALVALAAAAGFAAAGIAAATPASAHATNGQRVIYDCVHANAAPSGLLLACNDHSLYLTGLHYTEWVNGEAKAHGNAHLNDCMPDCASGHFHTYPVNIRLFKLVKGVHTPLFSELSIHYLTKPSGSPSRVTGSLPTKPVG